MTHAAASGSRIVGLETAAYRVPTESPEADGTLAWDSTTLVLVRAVTDTGDSGLGFSYTAAAAGELVTELLEPEVVGRTPESNGQAWQAMVDSARNVGLPGLAATAISAVDIALWDLRARLAELPLFRLLGERRGAVPVYASGGFTSYSTEQLAAQLTSWVDAGIPRVKMKIGLDAGRRDAEDVARVAAARAAIGPTSELMVDANGAYSAKQALARATDFAEHDVSYFEEPVSSDHLGQLAFVRGGAPMAIAAGEYGYTPWYFEEMLRAAAVDILQADATRCLGITGFLRTAQLAEASGVLFSAHTAPTIHAHAGCAAPLIEHVEYFHDHARLEPMLFEGVPQPDGGRLCPDRQRSGLGLELRPEAEQWRVR